MGNTMGHDEVIICSSSMWAREPPIWAVGEGYDFGHLITEALTEAYPIMILFVK